LVVVRRNSSSHRLGFRERLTVGLRLGRAGTTSKENPEEQMRMRTSIARIHR